jgi:Domain of unknown function (DUF4349)
MSEHRTDEISRELRATAPPAPDALRETVREITARETAPAPRRIAFRRIALVAVAGLLVLTVAAALTRDPDDGDSPSSFRGAPGVAAPEATPDATGGGWTPAVPSTAERLARRPFSDLSTTKAALPPGQRLQNYQASITIWVGDAGDLSAKAQQAMRAARRMGGFVASVDFATESESGTASLVLRVPVTRIQEAVARFSELGMIQAEHVEIDDLQPQADRLAGTISRLRKQIAALEAKQRRVGLTGEEQFRLETARRQLRTATQRRAAVVRQATYATVALDLTTRKSAQKEEPGAFGTFWDDASKILTTELIWLLYALVVAGPFVLLAILAFLAERTRRRRSTDALLAHH